jgi:hypothetical protein
MIFSFYRHRGDDTAKDTANWGGSNGKRTGGRRDRNMRRRNTRDGVMNRVRVCTLCLENGAVDSGRRRWRRWLVLVFHFAWIERERTCFLFSERKLGLWLIVSKITGPMKNFKITRSRLEKKSRRIVIVFSRQCPTHKHEIVCHSFTFFLLPNVFVLFNVLPQFDDIYQIFFFKRISVLEMPLQTIRWLWQGVSDVSHRNEFDFVVETRRNGIGSQKWQYWSQPDYSQMFKIAANAVCCVSRRLCNICGNDRHGIQPRTRKGRVTFYQLRPIHLGNIHIECKRALSTGKTSDGTRIFLSSCRMFILSCLRPNWMINWHRKHCRWRSRRYSTRWKSRENRKICVSSHSPKWL